MNIGLQKLLNPFVQVVLLLTQPFLMIIRLNKLFRFWLFQNNDIIYDNNNIFFKKLVSWLFI